MTQLAADGGPIQASGHPMTPVPFKEAIAWARARGVILPEVYYGELQGLARAMAFSIAGLAKLDQIQAVKDSLDANLAEGGTLREWQKRVKAGDIGLDLPAHRLEVIYRTNLQGNYNRGRCEQQRRTADIFPWRMYDAINDSRTRPAHAAMDGFVARHDDPIWKTWQAPNGYQCFLPGTTVRGDFQVGLKAWYSGGAVEVVTAQGSRLSVTVNHPILTSKGWVKAGQLKEGDDLLCYRDGIDGSIDTPVSGSLRSAWDINDKQAPIAVEQIFDALAAQRLGRAKASAFDLYGDALDFKGHVQVVGSASELMDGVCANGVQRGKDGLLGRGDHMAVRSRYEQLNAARASFASPALKIIPEFLQPLFYKRFRHADRFGNFFAASSLFKHLRQFAVKVRYAPSLAALPSCLALALNRASVFLYRFPFQCLSFASPARDDTLALQPVADSLPTDAKAIGYGFEAFSADILGNHGDGIFRRPSGGLNSAAALDSIGVLRRAAFDSVVAQQPVEHAVTDAALFEQLAHRCAGLIERDQVVSVRHFAFSGHVYDFQTANGLIAANGIITSNCRCRVIALTDKQAARFQAADARRMQDPEIADARASARPDKGWDYSVCSDPTEGLRRAVEAKRQQCGLTQFAANRGGGGKIWCQGKGADWLSMIEAVAQSRGEMPEPRQHVGIERLQPSHDEAALFSRFMREFGGEKQVQFTDVIGNSLEIGRDLFLNLQREWKIMKGERAQWLLYTAVNIQRPDEIWKEPGRQGGPDKLYYLSRFNVGRRGLLACIAVFEREQKASGAWAGRTNYATTQDGYAERKRDREIINGENKYWRRE